MICLVDYVYPNYNLLLYQAMCFIKLFIYCMTLDLYILIFLGKHKKNLDHSITKYVIILYCKSHDCCGRCILIPINIPPMKSNETM